MRVDRGRAGRPREHLQLRSRRVPHDAGDRRARPRRPRPALPRSRPLAGADVVEWRGRVADLPRRRPYARRAPAHPSRRSRGLPALPRRRDPGRRARARDGERAARTGRRPLEARAPTRSRRGDVAAMEPVDGCGRPAVVLHPGGGHGPRRDHWPGRVGPIPIRPAHGARRAHLRDEARRPRRTAGRRQRRGARQRAVGVRGCGRRGEGRSTGRCDPERGDARARGRARRRHRARGAARRVGVRSARDVRAMAARSPSGRRSSGGAVAGQAGRGGVRVEDRRGDH